MKGFTFALGVSLILAMSASGAMAADVHVETTGSDAPGCGTTVVSACATIQYGIGLAAGGDRVLVGPGTFTTSPTAGILINKAITLEGAGAGSTIVSGNDSLTYATPGTIRFSGTGLTQTVRNLSVTHPGRIVSSSASRYNFFLASSSPPAAGLNVTIEDVDAVGPGAGITGTGLETATNSGSLTIRNLDTSQIFGQQLLIQRVLGPVLVEDSTFNMSGTITSTAIIDANYSLGGAWPVTDPHVYRDNTFNARQGISVITGFTNRPGMPFNGITIQDNTFSDPGTGGTPAAIHIQNVSTDADGANGLFGPMSISGNSITGTNVGIVLTGRMNTPSLTGNNIRGNVTGVRLRRSTAAGATGANVPINPTLSANQIVGNTSAGVRVDAADVIPTDISGNWWGCNAGPVVAASPPAGNCDNVATASPGSMTLNNWIVLRIAATPSSVLADDGVASVSAGFDQLNTGGAAPSAFANGTVLPMTATSGTLTTASPTLSSGLAGNGFTSTSGTNRSASASFDNQTVTHEWDDDITVPVVTITSPPDGLETTDASIDVFYTVTDAGGGSTTCNIADGASVPLDFGPNTITVSCEDDAGNIGTDSVQVTRVDNTPPDVTITAPSNGLITSASSVTLNFTVSDATDTTCNHLDGASIPLSEGANTITVICTDEFGNTGYDSVSVIRDNTAPVVTIIAPANGSLTNQASVVLNYTVVEAFGIQSCTIADGSTIALNEGSNTITVSCTDAAGNVGTDSVTVTRDSIAPEVEITAPVNGSVTSASSTVLQFTASDAASDFTCDHDDGDSIPLAEGVNTITVTCTDEAGNVGTDSVTVTRDSIAPEVTITSPANGSVTTDSSTTLHFTVEDATDVTCNYDDGDTVNLVEGPNTITVECEDEAGNTGSASVTVIRDNTPPVVTILNPPDGLVTSAASVVLSYTVTDSYTATSCTPANGSTVNLSEGANTITVECEDEAGNVGSDTVTVTRDTTAPVVSITAPVNGTITASSSTTLTYSVTDATNVNCNRANNSSVSLSPGVNTIAVVCVDQAGNVGYDSVSVIRDNTAPVVTIVTPADGLITNATSTVVNYSVLNNYGTVSCDIADGSSVSLVEGTNTIEVECTDQAGNVGSDSVAVTRDTIPPVVTITAPIDDSSTTDPTTTLSYTVVDSTATECAPEDGDTIALNYGANTISVVCTDAAGNSSTANVTITRISTSPPVVSIISPAPGTIVNGESVVLTYVAASDHGTVTCTPPSGSTVPLAIGMNTIDVSCVDNFGNTASTKVTVYRPDTLPTCAKDVAITSVYRVGSKTRIVGRARLQFAGQKVRLQYLPSGSKTIASPKVASDGSFSVNVSRPPKPAYTSNNARYRAVLNSTSTPWIKLTRRMGRTSVVYNGDGRLSVNGNVSLPIAKGQPLRVERSDACGQYRQIGWLPVRSNGNFNGFVPTGGGSASAVMIRLRVRVTKASNPSYRFYTYSIVQPVIVDR